jgi:BirA family biotin operon repressor/biotin-[acetyl-CoA-carboxylase] ligase
VPLVLTRDDLLAALAEIRESAPVRAEEVTGSTNATAAALADDGAPEWTLVSAGHQTEGRGRLGRTWVDEPGRAFILSVVLRPTLAPARAGIMSLAAGAAMAEAIHEVAGRRATCKWPNDVLIRDGKVGGVLLESSV